MTSAKVSDFLTPSPGPLSAFVCFGPLALCGHPFQDLGHSQVIIVEDDLEVAPDFFDYFEATLPILNADQGQAAFSMN